MNNESLQLLPEDLGWGGGGRGAGRVRGRGGGAAGRSSGVVGKWQSKSGRSGVVLPLLTICLQKHTEPCKSKTLECCNFPGLLTATSLNLMSVKPYNRTTQRME